MTQARLQYNIVRIDGQRSVYVPVFKQGGNSNTITIVDGMKAAIKHLVDIPASLKTAVVFDQSVFVKLAIKNVIREALDRPGADRHHDPGLPRQPARHLRGAAVDSAFACWSACCLTNCMGGSINTMILGGLALVFSRLIDDAVVVLENIFRYMEMGESPREAAEKGGMEVSLAVLAATFTTSIVFFPGHLLSRHQQVHLYAAGAGRGAFDLRFVLLRDDGGAALLRELHPNLRTRTQRSDAEEGRSRILHALRDASSTRSSRRMLNWYEALAKRAMRRPGIHRRRHPRRRGC